MRGLPGGLAPVDAQGRNLSGGQRQRLRPARALLADPEVLLAVEPTSAVDAHTEAAVAARLRAARTGRTTVVTSTSPLLPGQADTVYYLVDGSVAAVGSHRELPDRQPGYRLLVSRGTADEDHARYGRAAHRLGDGRADPGRRTGPDQLRRHVVLVTQEHHVFLGTVRDNLRIASADATDAELRAALAAVGADWADELPDGLDTDLGHGAHRPDGARAQQLALTRVVLADPHTLILDEATALLDPRTARHTERAPAAVLEGRTVIAVAHRLRTAHDADRVAVMEDGRITELGTHDDLVTAGGAYAALWRSWHGERPPAA